MSAIGMSAPRGKNFVVSAYADYRHDHLFFARQQSASLRELDWEDRLKPLCPWSVLAMRAAGITVLAAAMLLMLI